MNAPTFLYYNDEALNNESDTMMLGRDVLVGFVFDEGEETTEVYLPEKDDWYLKDSLFKGGETVSLTVPCTDEVPFFVRSGSVIPFDDAEYGFGCCEDIVFTVYPLQKGEFKSDFFYDDGISFAYLNGDCVKVNFTVYCSEDKVTVKYHNSGKSDFSVKVKLCSGDKRKLEISEI